MPRWLPLLLTVLIFAFVAAFQIYFITAGRGAGYLTIGAILLAMGAAAVVLQIYLYLKAKP